MVNGKNDMLKIIFLILRVKDKNISYSHYFETSNYLRKGTKNILLPD